LQEAERDEARWYARASPKVSASHHKATSLVALAKDTNTMNLTKNPGRLLLGIWLIVTGLLLMVSIPIPARTEKDA
jgi:hypothetical protein